MKMLALAAFKSLFTLKSLEGKTFSRFFHRPILFLSKLFSEKFPQRFPLEQREKPSTHSRSSSRNVCSELNTKG
jgi:hypothetical protein